MAGSSASQSPPISPLVRWLVLILASIGFAFDTYEILMAPLVAPDALRAFGMEPGSGEFSAWVSAFLFVPAVFGGLFGLLGGYLTDLLGRRRVLTWSILIYAVSAFLAGYSTSPWMLLILRITTFVGVCVEFVAAVAWLAELFPKPEEREKALGLTQAFSSLGGLLVAIAYGLCNAYGRSFFPIAWPEFFHNALGPIGDAHAPWRYTLMSGLIPALPLLVIRPFLPESPVWKQKKQDGTLRRPNVKELFLTPELRRVTIITAIMFAFSFGAAFGAIQHIRRIVPGMTTTVQAKMAQERREAAEQGRKLPPPKVFQARVEGIVAAEHTELQEIGGLVGRFLFAVLVVLIVSQRRLIRIFQIPGLIITPLVFYFFLHEDINQTFFVLDLRAIYLGELPITVISLGIFLVGLFTVAQFSFWGNYLPRVFPLHLRGTGESFAANIGGRMIGTSFFAVTELLTHVIPGETYPERLALAAAFIGLLVYAGGLVTSFFLPEPKSELLPEFTATEEKTVFESEH